MAALAEAFVRVRADTTGVREDVRRDFEKTGGESGDAFGRRFTRDANGRLRDERGKFVSEGEKLGEGIGDGASRGFARKIGGSGGGGFGDLIRRAFDAITPNIPNLVRGVGAVGDSVNDLGQRVGRLGVTGASALVGLTANLGRLGVTGGAALAGITAGMAKLGVGAAALSTLAAGAASAAASLVSLAAALAPASGLLAALPGAIAVGAAAMGTLKVALLGVGDAFAAALSGDYEDFLEAVADLSPAASAAAFELNALYNPIRDLKVAVQDAFFQPLVGQITQLSVLLGPLRDGMAGVAAEFGRGALEIAEWARAPESIWAVEAVFRALHRSVAAMQPALSPLLDGFRDLGVIGAGWLADLAPGIAAATANLGTFAYHAAASGQALQWLDTGLAVVKQLGQVISEVAGILGALLRAAGGDALGGLVALLQSVNAALSGAQGQAALVEIFRSLQQVGRALAPVLSALLEGLGAVAPVVADVAVAMGPVLASAIGSLGPALAALGPGILAVVDGVSAGVRALGPALVPIGRSISDAFVAISPIFSALASALVMIVPKVIAVVAAFAPVGTTLINALAPALTAITPGLITVGNTLARAFANPVVTQGLLTLGQGISDLLVAAAPLIPTLASLALNLLNALLPALSALGPGLVVVGDALARAFARPEVAQALLDLGVGISNLLVAVSPLIEPLIQIAAILVERLGTALTFLAEFLKPVISALADFLAPILPQIAQLFREVSAALLPVAQQFGTELAGALRELMPHVQPIMDALREVGGQILTALRDVLPQVTPHFKDLARAFGEVVVELVKILPDLIRLGGEVLVELIKQTPVLIPMIKDLALQFLEVLKQLTPLLPLLLKLLVDVVLPLIPQLPLLLPPLIDLTRTFTELLIIAAPLLAKLAESEEVAKLVAISGSILVLAFDTVKRAIDLAVGAVRIFLGVFFGLPGEVNKGAAQMGNAIKNWLNDIIGWFEGVINIIFSGMPGFVSVQFPRLANGAIVDKATMAMIGEAGREVVIPLTRPQRAVELAQQSGLTDLIARSFRVPDLSARPLSLSAAAAGGGAASAAGPAWDDRPLIGTYVAAPGQTPQRLMSDLRLEAIGASW